MKKITFILMLCLVAPVNTFAADGGLLDEPAAAAVATATAPTTVPVPAATATTATATPVAATTPATLQSWWQVLVAELLQVIVIIFAPVLGSLIFVLLRKWGLKIELDQVNTVAKSAVGFGEQAALKALREGKGKTDGAVKLKTALDFGMGLAETYKLPKRATDKLCDLIEAKLGEAKLDASKPVEEPKPAEV